MSAYHCLIEIAPYDPVSEARQTVRVSSADLRSITGLGGNRWEPALIEPPKTSITLFAGDFADPVKPGGARLPINLTRLRRSHAWVDGAYWPGATVEIRIGREGDAWPWPVHFAGRVKSFGRERDTLALACEVDEEPFRKRVLNLTYAGTGGAEGGSDLTDKPKPLVIGHAKNVEPQLIDADNSVYQFSGYGPIEAVTALFERAADFGASTGNYASYAALVAATIPAGRWATCLAEGMVRLGAPAYGVITGEVKGHEVGGATPRLTGEVIATLADIAGVDAERIDTDTLDAMDTAAPYPINLVLDGQVMFVDIARRLALPCNHQCGVSLTGDLFVTGVGIAGGSSLTLHAQGRAVPQVLDSKELAVSPPYARTMLGANRAWRVHTADEIAFDAPLIPRGAYDNTATYRLGNYVTSPDKSEWIYVFDDPTSGNAPPTWPTTSNTWWANKAPPTAYADGTLIEDLKPADPGATDGATLPDPDGTGGNIKDSGGDPVDPGLIRNDMLELTSGGLLRYSPTLASDPIELGQLLLPDLGAASEAAINQAGSQIDLLAETVVRLTTEASFSRETMLGAGISVDPTNGTVRIHAVDQVAESLNEVEVRLDAAESSILLRASFSYVDEKIALAVFDPSQIADLEDIYARLTAAEIAIDGLDAAVTLRALVIDVDAIDARVTTAEADIDALEAEIVLKVDTTEFDALETRVDTAETTLSAIGNTAEIASAVRVARLVEAEQDQTGRTLLEAIVNDDRNQRTTVVAIAEARQELTSTIIDGQTAESSARLQLAARVGTTEAGLVTESTARAAEDAALAGQITTLSAELEDETEARIAAVQSETQARVTQDEVSARDVRGLTVAVAGDGQAALAALVTGDAASRNASTAIADARREMTTRITEGESASATERRLLEARIGSAEASIASESQARSTADTALAGQITTLSASLDDETDARVAAVSAEASARASADSTLASSIETVSTTVDGHTASITSFADSIDGLEAKAGLRIEVGGVITGYLANNDGEEGDFTILADNFAIVDPSGGERTEYSDGNWRTYDSSGQLRTQLGVWA